MRVAIRARAEMRLAEEYDAAQERGEVRTQADNQHVVSDNKLSPQDLGIRRDEILAPVAFATSPRSWAALLNFGRRVLYYTTDISEGDGAVSDESKAYYYALQNVARERTAASLNRRLLKSGGIQRWDKLTLCSIIGSDPGDALKFAEEEWRKHYGPATHNGFSRTWEQLTYKSLNDTDHFNLAVWQKVDEKQVLVALALGAPSNRRKYLTIKWIERYFGHSYLAGRALWPILTCAEEYARLLGSEKVLIKDPVDPSKYERYGYEQFAHPGVRLGGNYYGKDMTYG